MISKKCNAEEVLNFFEASMDSDWNQRMGKQNYLNIEKPLQHYKPVSLLELAKQTNKGIVNLVLSMRKR